MIFDRFIANLYKKKMLRRHDPDGSVFYFSPADFEGLKVEPFELVGNEGQKLQGYFYSINNTHPEKLVIFEHGMGCGHRAYMQEIMTIVNAGYLVFAYDHTGTCESEGEHIGGFSQSLADLDAVVTTLLKTDRCKGLRLSVIGHSWGGFSTMNIAAFHPEITHIVALSGYISVRGLIEGIFGRLRGCARKIFAEELSTFGVYALADARLSLYQTRAKALIISSKDDNVVPISYLRTLKKALAGRENISFLELDGKRHNPTYTVDAVDYKDAFFAELTKRRKKKLLSTDEAKREFVASYDFVRMTAQDPDVWDTILSFIKS